MKTYSIPGGKVHRAYGYTTDLGDFTQCFCGTGKNHTYPEPFGDSIPYRKVSGNTKYEVLRDGAVIETTPFKEQKRHEEWLKSRGGTPDINIEQSEVADAIREQTKVLKSIVKLLKSKGGI